MYYAHGEGCFLRGNWPIPIFTYTLYVDTPNTSFYPVKHLLVCRDKGHPASPLGALLGALLQIPTECEECPITWITNGEHPATPKQIFQLLPIKELFYVASLELSLRHYPQEGFVIC